MVNSPKPWELVPSIPLEWGREHASATCVYEHRGSASEASGTFLAHIGTEDRAGPLLRLSFYNLAFLLHSTMELLYKNHISVGRVFCVCGIHMWTFMCTWAHTCTYARMLVEVRGCGGLSSSMMFHFVCWSRGSHLNLEITESGGLAN